MRNYLLFVDRQTRMFCISKCRLTKSNILVSPRNSDTHRSFTFKSLPLIVTVSCTCRTEEKKNEPSRCMCVCVCVLAVQDNVSSRCSLHESFSVENLFSSLNHSHFSDAPKVCAIKMASAK